MNASDPQAMALQSFPMATLWNNPQVKGVLALGDSDAQQQLINATLSRFGGMFSDLGGKIKQYGAAGFISLVVESVAYWVAIIIPASAFMYHRGYGAGEAWLPALGDPESVAEFGKLLGATYVFSKIPPIEAARWAWAIAMIPWFQERLPPWMKVADGNMTALA
jgi:hypothetical protein